MNTPNPETASTPTQTAATLIKRADYKTIKHMDREALTAYLSRIYIRGYEPGQKSTALIAATEDKQGEVK